MFCNAVTALQSYKD